MRDNTNLIIVYILSCFISTSREVYNKLMYADVLKQLNYVFAAPVTDRLLMTVAQKLGANSMELGVMLGFQHVDVERMRCDERDALSLNFAILGGTVAHIRAVPARCGPSYVKLLLTLGEQTSPKWYDVGNMQVFI